MKKSVAASEKPVKAKEFDKELFKRSVEYNVRTLYRKNLEEADLPGSILCDQGPYRRELDGDPEGI